MTKNVIDITGRLKPKETPYSQLLKCFEIIGSLPMTKDLAYKLNMRIMARVGLLEEHICQEGDCAMEYLHDMAAYISEHEGKTEDEIVDIDADVANYLAEFMLPYFNGEK